MHGLICVPYCVIRLLGVVTLHPPNLITPFKQCMNKKCQKPSLLLICCWTMYPKLFHTLWLMTSNMPPYVLKHGLTLWIMLDFKLRYCCEPICCSCVLSLLMQCYMMLHDAMQCAFYFMKIWNSWSTDSIIKWSDSFMHSDGFNVAAYPDSTFVSTTSCHV